MPEEPVDPTTPETTTGCCGEGTTDCGCTGASVVDPATLVIPTSALTDTTLEGAGVFDVLMRAVDTHLEREFKAQRIKGPEYATVYLGALQHAMSTAADFLLKQKATELGNRVLAQQGVNAALEGKVLKAQECKLRAEYDLTMATTLKVGSEQALLDMKVVTERAQTQALGVDIDSVIGRQKQLYQAQTEGFEKDAKVKVAKAMMDTWNVRRTTDEGTLADSTNKLSDANIGRAVEAMLTSVNA